jgi:hypothetical protein
MNARPPPGWGRTSWRWNAINIDKKNIGFIFKELPSKIVGSTIPFITARTLSISYAVTIMETQAADYVKRRSW